MLTVLIPEKIPAHNKGEEAIFRGIFKTLDFIAQKKIYMYSKNPEYDKSQYKETIDIVTESLVPDPENAKIKKLVHVLEYIPMHVIYAFLYRLNRRLARKVFNGGIWKVYDEMDFVLVGHDNSYGVLHNLLVIFCNIINKPVIIYGATIKKHLYIKRWIKYLTKICLNKADLITTREEITRDVLVEKIGVKKNLVKLTADKAFLMEPIEKTRAIKLLEKHGVFWGKENIVGITAVYKTGIFNMLEVNIEKHLDVMAMLVDFIVEKTKAKVVFFPHSIGPDEANDDRIAATAIFSKCNQKEKIKLITEDFTAAELKGMIGCCDFFIGERTHSIIAAVSMKVPSMSISHSEDDMTLGILGMMVGMEKRIYNIKEMEVDLITRFFLDAWNNRDEIKESLNERIPDIIRSSFKNGEYLHAILNSRGIT